MTASSPAPRDDTGVREARRCGCGHVHRPETPRDHLLSELHALTNEDFDWSDAEWFTDALLPTVRRLIDQGKAEALREAALSAPVVRFDNGYPIRAVPVSDLLSFAAALDPTEGRR